MNRKHKDIRSGCLDIQCLLFVGNYLYGSYSLSWEFTYSINYLYGNYPHSWEFTYSVAVKSILVALSQPYELIGLSVFLFQINNCPFHDPLNATIFTFSAFC